MPAPISIVTTGTRGRVLGHLTAATKKRAGVLLTVIFQKPSQDGGDVTHSKEGRPLCRGRLRILTAAPPAAAAWRRDSSRRRAGARGQARAAAATAPRGARRGGGCAGQGATGPSLHDVLGLQKGQDALRRRLPLHAVSSDEGKHAPACLAWKAPQTNK
jgi:hypothetical protein